MCKLFCFLDNNSKTPMKKLNSAKNGTASNNHPQTNQNQKLKIYKEQLSATTKIPTSHNTYLDKEGMETVYKIASELLDSIKVRKDLQQQEANKNENNHRLEKRPIGILLADC